MHRSIPPYDPIADAVERWPDWSIVFADLGGVAAIYSARNRSVKLDCFYWLGREADAVALVVAHLDFGHHLQAEALTEEQKELGRMVAQVRMDRIESRVGLGLP